MKLHNQLMRYFICMYRFSCKLSIYVANNRNCVLIAVVVLFISLKISPVGIIHPFIPDPLP